MPIYEGQLIQSGGLISGSTDLYANLPDPSLHESEVWYVAEGSGGALAFTKTFYKYPKGLYSPNGLVWEQIPLNVHLAEDSTTLVNVTNWPEFYGFAFDISAGDRLIFNGKDYVNKTGTQTTTSPDLDSVNWGSYIVFNPSVTPPIYQKGLTFYDDEKNALSYYNDEEDITVNAGQEILIPVYNDTGATIENGSIVYPTGAIGNRHTIGLASADIKEKCRLVAMATHDIENNSTGYVTRLGSVGGIDTTGLSGIIYLSSTTPGAYTMTKPTGGAFIIAIGAIKEVGVNGSITVDPNITELTVEVTDTNGFPSDQRSGTTISFEDSTRTFTIAPDGTDFHYYVIGDKFEKTLSESITIENTEGFHVFYYEGETLKTVANPNTGQIDLLIRTVALIAYVYWDASNSVSNYFSDERHGISMSPTTHAYLHFTRGAQYLGGLALNTFSVDGSGNINASAQFGTDSGLFADEDIVTNIPDAISSLTGLPIYYLDGTAGDLRRISVSGYSVLTDIDAGSGATGRLVYNEFTGTTWQLSTITNGDFVLCHVFAINGVSGSDQMVAFIGQADYLNASSARAGAETEIANLLTVIPVQELIPIGTIIFQTRDNYTNDVQARIISTDDGADYVDWRSSEIVGGTAVSHNNLANLQLAGPAVTWGHISSVDPIALPVFTTTERDALASPQEGWHIYNSTTKTSQTYNGTSWV